MLAPNRIAILAVRPPSKQLPGRPSPPIAFCPLVESNPPTDSADQLQYVPQKPLLI
jgi:hypothetical protein